MSWTIFQTKQQSQIQTNVDFSLINSSSLFISLGIVRETSLHYFWTYGFIINYRVTIKANFINSCSSTQSSSSISQPYSYTFTHSHGYQNPLPIIFSIPCAWQLQHPSWNLDNQCPRWWQRWSWTSSRRMNQHQTCFWSWGCRYYTCLA